MKKALQFAVIASFFASFQVFAHHAAVDIVDEDTYEMIEQNLEDADSPHLTMTLDDLMVGTSR